MPDTCLRAARQRVHARNSSARRAETRGSASIGGGVTRSRGFELRGQLAALVGSDQAARAEPEFGLGGTITWRGHGAIASDAVAEAGTGPRPERASLV